MSQETDHSTDIDAHEVLGGKAHPTKMHIAEGFLPPAHAVAWTIAAAPFVVHGAIQVVATVKRQPSAGPLLAAVGAFSFVMYFLVRRMVSASTSSCTLEQKVMPGRSVMQ